MATQAETLTDEQDDDVLDLSEDDIVDDGEPQDDGGDEDQGQEEDESFIGFADEQEDAAPAPEPALVKHLREEIRKRDKRLAETQKAVQPEPEIVVGPRPKAADFDYDDDRLEAALDEWEERKTAAVTQASRREDAKRAQEQQWSQVTQRYAEQKAALRIANKDQAEQVALDTLSPTAQALIAKHADNAAQFMVAVGLSPTKLAELARIDGEGDPFAVVKAVTKMEATLQTKRPAARPPNPDVPVRGKPISASGADKQLEKLEAEADRTGDRSKVIAFKRAQREKAK